MLCVIAQNAFFSYTIVTIVLVLETNALKTSIQTSAPHNYTIDVATSKFQEELILKLLLTGIHLQKWAVAPLSYSPLSYSPASRLHPKVIYTTAFSAGLNGLHVH